MSQSIVICNPKVSIDNIDGLADRINKKYDSSEGAALVTKQTELEGEFAIHSTENTNEFNNVYGRLEGLDNGQTDLQTRTTKLEARPGALQMSIQSREWESKFRGKMPYVGKVVFVKIDGAQEDLDALAADGCRIVLLRRKKVKRNNQSGSVDPFNYRRSKTKWSLSANPLPTEGIVPQFPLLNEFALPTKVGEWSPLYTVTDNTL